MPSALIGHTGFVGGHLARQNRFDDFYNSKNIEQIAGRSYDLLVCSGASAVKWLANQRPEEDRRQIERLISCLQQVRAREVVLISTVDVFQSSVGADEDSPVTTDGLCPYGKHRFELEEFVRSRFASLVVRLPGLFGQGLKKNVIYDFLHGNNTDRIHAASVFQFYDLLWLWPDMNLARDADLELVHFATEPVSVAEIALEVFDTPFSNEAATPPAQYDLRSRFASLFGGAGGYLRDRNEVLDAMRAFVRQEAPSTCR
jgi:nucleoside-diphosphate-sugar epimerase